MYSIEVQYMDENLGIQTTGRDIKIYVSLTYD